MVFQGNRVEYAPGVNHTFLISYLLPQIFERRPVSHKTSAVIPRMHAVPVGGGRRGTDFLMPLERNGLGLGCPDCQPWATQKPSQKADRAVRPLPGA